MGAGLPSNPQKKYRLNLALQGGGAHGAFTWGVLDRLLDEKDIELVGITGTSAGAINAALLVDGMASGGREAAKQQLHDFWYDVSRVGNALSPWAWATEQAEKSPFAWLEELNPLEMLTHNRSPYELNPLNINPLRELLEKYIDHHHFSGSIKLFVTATNVETGQPRVFETSEISRDVLLASACLPLVFQAVEINGVPYWDGGYMGNPSIWPLFYKTNCDDVLLVQLNPLCRRGEPKTMMDIVNRLNEITFNASLVAEMRAISFVKKMIDQGKLSPKEYSDVRMHLVHLPSSLEAITASSKGSFDWAFYRSLHDAGRAEMDTWLMHHKAAIGRHATLDIDNEFLLGKVNKPKKPKKMSDS